MSLEAIKKVTDTEQMCAAKKAAAQTAAKRAIGEAEKLGRESLESARQKADAQAKTLMAEAEANAAKYKIGVEEQTKQACAELRKVAEGRLEDAAALIVRRVVNV